MVTSTVKKPRASRSVKTAKTIKPEVVAKSVDNKYFEAIGRRKSAIARVRLYVGAKGVLINDRNLDKYFSIKELQDAIEMPFKLTNSEGQFKTVAKVTGGGITGQAEAIRLGISRALIKIDPSYKINLKHYGYLTRDSRRVERKKYGLKKARRAPQWQKR